MSRTSDALSVAYSSEQEIEISYGAGVRYRGTILRYDEHGIDLDTGTDLLHIPISVISSVELTN